MATQFQTIEYAYPDLGPVEVKLQKESAEIYKFIKKQTEGTEFFERLDQLGALRFVHKSAHHSRWEHMVLQMYLAQQLKANYAFGFSTSVRLTTQLFVSSLEELLKSWVLLNNYGHLLDTFEAERVWLELILENPELRQVLISSMPDDLSKKLATRVLKDEDIFNFHHLITLALLRRWNEKKSKSNTPFVSWIEMIKTLLKDATGISKPKEGSKLNRALSVYNKLRRFTYVLLDINSTTLFLRIEANNLLRNILENPDVVLYDPESDINKTLEDMEHLLFSQLYANQQACIFKYHHIQGQKRNFANIVSKNGIGAFCLNRKVFATQLHQAKIQNFGKYKPNVKIKHLCRLNLLPNFVFERNACRFHTEHQKLRTETSELIDFLITPAPYTKGGNIIDVFTAKDLDVDEISTLYDTLAKYIAECYEGWVTEAGGLNFVMSVPLQELFSHILSIFVNSNLNLRFPKGTSIEDSNADIIIGKVNKGKWIKRFTRTLKERKLPPDRTWELSALLQLLKRQNGKLLLIAISNIHLYNPDGTSKAEWDGAFFDIGKDNITLYVLEAKRNVSRRSQECSSALMSSIEKAGIQPKQGRFPTIRCHGYSYTRIALTDILPLGGGAKRV
jgi:hypothetical protein